MSWFIYTWFEGWVDTCLDDRCYKDKLLSCALMLFLKMINQVISRAARIGLHLVPLESLF